jgi:(p)ppGpp synthase/HD superfamily hydrolase
MPTLADAIALAAEAHRTQTDKAGEPYVLHPLRVMLRLETEEERIVGVLHDVAEDTPVGVEELRRLGYSERVVAAVDSLTRRKGLETYEAFVERLSSNPLAARVKIADLEDNMDLRRLSIVGPEEAERLARYRAAWGKLKRLGVGSGAKTS